MMIEEAAGLVVQTSRELGIPIMIVGSLSSNFYGIPRSTNDADLVVQLQPGQLTELVKRLGPEFRLDPQPAIESITGTTKFVLDVLAHPFIIELFELSDDPFDQERFRRRQAVRAYGGDVWLATAEDVVVMKLRWYERARRTRDWEDARSVLAVQADKLDWDYMEGWCDQHGSREHLEKLRQLVRPAADQG